MSEFDIGRILNHKRQGVTGRYNQHEYDLEKRKALTKWGRELRRIIKSEKGKVVSLRTAS